MATSKYFSNAWGTRITQGRSAEDDNLFDIGWGDASPDLVCEKQSQPETMDCAAIDVSTQYGLLDLGKHDCYFKGDRSWCDVSIYGTCQLSIGWNSNKPRPTVNDFEVNSAFQGALSRQAANVCSPANEDKAEVCAVGPIKICKPAWKFCMKRVGVDCVWDATSMSL
jgi:hypothetical protein